MIVLGGTRFIGRAITEALTAQGHAVLVAHRGVNEPDGLPAAEHLHAERAAWPHHRAVFAAFGADAAVDVSVADGPGARAALAALPPGLALVALSSVDVYRAYESLHSGKQTDLLPLTEESPLRTTRHVDGLVWENLDVEEAYLGAGATVLRLGAVRLHYEQVIAAAAASLELVRVPDEALPPDLAVTGTISQHLMASPARAREVLGWRATAGPPVLRRAVAWHLSHPPGDADTDFSADDQALAAAP